jgi:hypothetical protein
MAGFGHATFLMARHSSLIINQHDFDSCLIDGGRCIHQVLHKINETTHDALIDRYASAPAIAGFIFLVDLAERLE